jgi:hypothetical protein
MDTKVSVEHWKVNVMAVIFLGFMIWIYHNNIMCFSFKKLFIMLMNTTGIRDFA